jgi:pimeloyl-ACP methyl ester carboxylesterase
MMIFNQYKCLLSLAKQSNRTKSKNHFNLDQYTLMSRQLLTLFSLSLSLIVGACDDDSTEGSEDPSPMVRAGDTAGDTAGMSAGDTAGMSAGDTAGTLPPPPQGTDGYLARLTIDDEARGPAFAAVEDMNGDGKLDLIVSKFGPVGGFTIEPGQITIYYQGESLSDWTQEEVTSETEALFWPNGLEIMDVDGDGDLDVTVGSGFLICEILGRIDANGENIPPSPCGGLIWFERDGTQWIRHDVVGPESGLFYHHWVLADIDQDGIDDLFTVGERRYFDQGELVDIAETQWFKGQMGGDLFESTPRVIGPGMGSFATLTDLDGDGDLDAYSAEYFADFESKSFAWYEQTEAPSAANPAGVWVRHIIDDQVGPSIQFSWVEDLFGPGKSAFVGSNHTQTTGDEPDPWESALFVYEPTDDIRAPWSGRQISENIVSVSRSNQAAPGIFGVGDINGDGRKDILASGDGDPRVFALLQGENEQFETWVLDDNLPQAGAVRVRDFNGDGRDELIVTSYDQNVIYLYYHQENSPHPLRRAELPEWGGGAPGGTMAGGSEPGGMMTGGGQAGSMAGDSTGGDQPLTGFDLEIQYTGALTGPLVVAAFASWPPLGPPSAFDQIPSPSFPARVSLPQLEAGTYTILAFIDVDNSGPMSPTDADVQSRVELSFPNTAPAVINLDGEPVSGLEVVTNTITRGMRSTPVTVYLPEDGMPRPLIVFTPGFQVPSTSYAPMLESLAREGYVIARLDPPGTPFDVNHLEMGADVRAGLDWILDELGDRIIADQIATMGHSLGGKIAILNAAQDPRVKATLALDPVDGDPSPFPDPMTRPTLAPMVTGQVTGAVGIIGELTNGESSNPFAPACAPLANNFQTLYSGLSNASWIVEWELIGADHMDFLDECPEGIFSPCALCEEGTMDPARVRELSAQFASDFFGLHLLGLTDREASLTSSPGADVVVR